MKYRKKPVVIEAEQFFPEKHPWPAGLNGGSVSEPRLYVVTAHDQRVYVEAGDWIVPEGPKHPYRYYPIKPDIFAETYEAVVEYAAKDRCSGPSAGLDAGSRRDLRNK